MRAAAIRQAARFSDERMVPRYERLHRRLLDESLREADTPRGQP